MENRSNHRNIYILFPGLHFYGKATPESTWVNSSRWQYFNIESKHWNWKGTQSTYQRTLIVCPCKLMQSVSVYTICAPSFHSVPYMPISVPYSFVEFTGSSNGGYMASNMRVSCKYSSFQLKFIWIFPTLTQSCWLFECPGLVIGSLSLIGLNWRHLCWRQIELVSLLHTLIMLMQ